VQLKDFIKETLLNITQGVQEANEVTNRFELSDQVHGAKRINGTSVEFEVGVVVTESTTQNKEDKAGGGVNISVMNMGFKAGASGSKTDQTDNANQSAHNLKFQVFVSENESKKPNPYGVLATK
jgi:hypothetical protein